MTTYAKPPLTFEQQADRLLSRGLIGDRATMLVRLQTVNYYRLLGYSFPYRLRGAPNDQFAPGTSFETIWDDYVFDQKLRVLVMTATERFEVAARTQLAYHHAHAHGGDAYATNPASLPRLTTGPVSEKRSHAAFVDKLGKNLYDNRDQQFISHFKRKYTSSPFPPIWVTAEVMSLGNVVVMFQGARDRERELVATTFGITSGEFQSWLLMFQTIRNICAHHGRLWNRSLGKIPQLPRMRTHPTWYLPVNVGGTKLFTVLTICGYVCGLLSTTSTWTQRMKDLITEHPGVPLAEMGFPERWRLSPLWA